MAKNIVLAALAGLFTIQVVWALDRQPETPTAQHIRVDDPVPALPGLDTPVEHAVATVYLAFRSECSHCARVAPDWAEWLRRPSDGVRVVAVTTDTPLSAEGYANRFEWDVNVAAIDTTTHLDAARFFISRTPWIFVADAQGVLRFHGHGSQLGTVDDVLLQLRSEASS